MRRQLIGIASAGALAAGLAAAVTVSGGAAGAALTTGYFGYAGGSQVRAADTTVTSDLSVQSTVNTNGQLAKDTKSTVDLSAGGVLTTGAISTSAEVEAVSGGKQVVATARTANVSLLGGLITLDAVTTTATSSSINGELSSEAHSDFAGLHIAGVNLPVTIPQNYGVSIPGVATISLNTSLAGTSGTTSVGIGSGLTVTLLKPAGDSSAGATIYLAPTFSEVATVDVPDTGHTVFGDSFGTKVSAKVGSTVGLTSDQTATSQVPPGGTGGKLQQVGVAGVNVAPALTVGAVTTTMKATNTKALADVQTTSKVAGISLLGGLISADAVTTTAKAHAPTGKVPSISGSSAITNLVIAGKTISLKVKPNTTIDLAGLGKVVVNEQLKNSNGIQVRALHITLSTAGFGLAAGAEIIVASSYAAAF